MYPSAGSVVPLVGFPPAAAAETATQINAAIGSVRIANLPL
jgi:hypothetical protein